MLETVPTERPKIVETLHEHLPIVRPRPGSIRGLVALFGIRNGGGNILFPGQAGMGGLIASANSDAMTHALQPERSYNFKPGTHSER